MRNPPKRDGVGPIKKKLKGKPKGEGKDNRKFSIVLMRFYHFNLVTIGYVVN